MKKNIFSVLIILIFASLINTSIFLLAMDTAQTNWKKVIEVWKDYSEAPNYDNLKKIFDVLPDRPADNRILGSDEVKAINFIYNHLSKLRKDILCGNKLAAKVGFRLIIIADGDFAETLTLDLGKLIRKNPGLFLQELKKIREVTDFPIDSLVANYEEDLVSDKMQLLETEKRIKCIEQVKDKNLKELKNECLKILNDLKVLLDSNIEKSRKT